MRQPNWKRWEVLLVDMYFRIKETNADPKEECRKLSSFLRKSNLTMAIDSPTYRNHEGVLMKYQNIRHLVEGVGLSAHSKMDVEIVDLYQNENEIFKYELKSILSV